MFAGNTNADCATVRHPNSYEHSAHSDADRNVAGNHRSYARSNPGSYTEAGWICPSHGSGLRST